MAEPRELVNFVASEPRPARHKVTSPVVHPSTGEVIALAPVTGEADLDDAFAARQLDFGAVWTNTRGSTVQEMPHGGFKQSGYGKDLSMYGFEEYTRVKHVMSYIGR